MIASAEMFSLRHYPDAVLALEAREVTDIDKGIALLAQTMAEVMYANNGVGLAANQIGITKRVFVYDEELSGNYSVVVNPKLSLGAEMALGLEGCLSVPNNRSHVERAISCHLTGLDLNGNDIEIEATGLLARIFQHEVDHLNGLLIIDRAQGTDSLKARYGF